MRRMNFRTLLCMCLLSLPILVNAQQKLSPNESKVMVNGTSTLHDWRCKVEQLSGNLDVEKSGTTIKSIKLMDVTMIVKSMKSLKEDGKYYDSGMDKNVYKALDADKNPQITFVLKKINSIGANGEVNAIATVKIAGVAKDLPVVGVAKVLPNGSVKITGKKAFKMTDFKVDPPKAMLGAIKTGDDITVDFDLLFK
ncbi:hypothetical protein C3K47_13760 [Solitalea longa]|uniref:Lipid/polyisoprenoid-binding YceI-like domain-containing protein n=1 Tax=Solitalea longa TaxID=2079460 RepID=A0A2S5A108_9SPHI|nr:YceI family protein [Solitalea longa]POY35813.1 hypothetical protein C3K47_13760 [Solitalea longa]